MKRLDPFDDKNEDDDIFGTSRREREEREEEEAKEGQKDRVTARVSIHRRAELSRQAREAYPLENKRWHAVRLIRDCLLERPNGWEVAWEHLADLYPCIDRDKHRVSSEPFDAIMFYVEKGVYPPPELLIWLCDAWYDYLNSERPLEHILFGKPKRKAGGYRVKQRALRVNLKLALEISERQRLGKTKEEAAAEVAREFKQGISGKSLLARLEKQGWYRCRQALLTVMAEWKKKKLEQDTDDE